MCELGLAIGLMSGALSAAGSASASSQNQEMIHKQAELEQGENARNFIVEANAANKEAYNASQQADRNKSYLKTASGSMGSTVGERNAEQSKQGALSIANARDRTEAAQANLAFASTATQIEEENRKKQAEYSPLSAFADIAGSGLSNYGAFS